MQLASLTVSGSTFIGNYADQYGGAVVQLSTGAMDISNSTFDSNLAGEAGGGLAVATASASDR